MDTENSDRGGITRRSLLVDTFPNSLAFLSTLAVGFVPFAPERHTRQVPEGTSWEAGIRSLRGKTEGPAETVLVYEGSKEEGRFIFSAGGTRRYIHISPVQCAHILAERGSRERIERGIGIAHSHQHPFLASLQKTLASTQPAPVLISRPGQVIAMHGAPSILDVNSAVDPLFEVYMEKAGIKHGPVVHGSVTKTHLWEMQRMTPEMLSTSEHADTRKFIEEKDMAHASIKAKLVAFFSKDLRAVFPLADLAQLNEWEGVLTTEAERIEVIAEMLIQWGLLWPQNVGFVFAGSEEGIAALSQLQKYWETYSPMLLLPPVQASLIARLHSGEIGFDEAREEYADALKRMCGLTLTCTEHGE